MELPRSNQQKTQDVQQDYNVERGPDQPKKGLDPAHVSSFEGLDMQAENVAKRLRRQSGFMAMAVSFTVVAWVMMRGFA